MDLSLSETYFTDKYVSRGVEYAPDKFVVCLQDDEQFYILDRSKRQVKTKIQWDVPDNCPNSFNLEVIKLPGFNIKKFPFLLMRDDYGIKILNVVTKRLVKVKDANYGSNAGYKTLDLLTSPKSQSPCEFEVVYLETGEADAPNSMTTSINRMLFTSAFIYTLKQLAAGQ